MGLSKELTSVDQRLSSLLSLHLNSPTVVRNQNSADPSFCALPEIASKKMNSFDCDITVHTGIPRTVSTNKLKPFVIRLGWWCDCAHDRRIFSSIISTMTNRTYPFPAHKVKPMIRLTQEAHLININRTYVLPSHWFVATCTNAATCF